MQSPPDTSPPLGEVESGVRAEEETEETDPGHFILSNSVSAEVQKIEAVVVSSTAAADATAATEAPSTDLMSRMMGGLPSWGMFSAAESEDEVHNAWGEQDSEEMLGQRALELHQARGIELPGVPIETSAQARLAKRKQKAKAQAKRKAHLEVTNAEATGSHLFAGTSSMMSMLSNFTSMGRAVSSNADEEEVHNAWGDDTDSKLVERAAELEQARGIVVPMPQVQSTGRERLAKRRQKAQKQNNEAVVSSTTAADATATETPSTDLMSRMMGGLPSWGMFSAAESEDEVHNAWGEQDTEEMLGQRALELHQARGIELPGVPIETSAQARLAKRKQKAKAQAKRKAHLEVTNAEATGSHLFAGTSSMMSMLSNFTSMGRAVSSNADEEEVHNAWGDDTDSKLVERAAELEQARGIVVPMPQVQSTGRERLAKRRQKAQKQNNETVVVEADTAEPTSAGRVTASFFAAAATGIVQFQRWRFP